MAQRLKHLPPMRETWVQSLGREDPLEKEMVTHSGILAWRIPWTEKPDRLQSTGSQSRTRLSDFTFKVTQLGRRIAALCLVLSCLYSLPLKRLDLKILVLVLSHQRLRDYEVSLGSHAG